jgi:hypothetical protein
MGLQKQDMRNFHAWVRFKRLLKKFQHDAPKHPQHTPSRYVTPVYGAKIQYDTKDETPPLTEQQCLTIQKVTGAVLYYARAVDSTVLLPLNDITTEQTKSTEMTQAATNQMLDYLATHRDATIRYHASDMILHIQSDASYLSVSHAQSRLGGMFFPGQQIPRARNTQRINPQRRSRHQKHGGLSCRIRSWSVLPQRPECRPAQSHTHRAGQHTTPNASENR